jgi:hypothetical protein
MRKTMLALPSRQASLLARRIAFRVLVAEIPDKPSLDRQIRVSILEGAAGAPWGSWSRPDPTRGLSIAQETFPNADPRWFSKWGTYFIGRLLSGVQGRMQGYDESTIDDAIFTILGNPQELSKLGKKYRKSIANGKPGYVDALKGVSTIGKSRGRDYVRDHRHLQMETGFPTDEDGNIIQTDRKAPTPSSKEMSLTTTDAMEDLILIDRRLMTVAKTVIGRMKDGTRKQVMEIWLSNPRLTNRDIASQLGVSGAFVGQTKAKVFALVQKKADRYLDILRSKYARAQKIAALWLDEQAV